RLRPLHRNADASRRCGLPDTLYLFFSVGSLPGILFSSALFHSLATGYLLARRNSHGRDALQHNDVSFCRIGSAYSFHFLAPLVGGGLLFRATSAPSKPHGERNESVSGVR